MIKSTEYYKNAGGDNPVKKTAKQLKPVKITGTVFDDVFKTLSERLPELLIPVINEVFGTGYEPDKEVIQLKEELHTVKGRLVADSILYIDGMRYHIEIQSNTDGTMTVRMAEYDFAIALDNIVRNEYEYEIEFPKSCVLYIRHNSSTPDFLTLKIMSDGDSLIRRIPIVRLQDYTITDIFRKNLLMFLPYYIVRYEEKLKNECGLYKRPSGETLDKLSKDYGMIYDKLDSELTDEQESLKREIIESIEAISSHVLSHTDMDETDKEEVRKAMGGQVIEMIFDKAEREGREKGLNEGRMQGIQEGIQQGERRTLFNLYDEGHISSQVAAEKLGLSQEQFMQEYSGLS